MLQTCEFALNKIDAVDGNIDWFDALLVVNYENKNKRIMLLDLHV